MKIRHMFACALVLSLSGIAGAQADAVTFNLIYQLDDGTTGDFGDVTVTEVGGDLLFEINRGPDLHFSADLSEFYFNLNGDFTGLSVTTSDSPTTPYTFSMPATERGDSMFEFEAEVNFGNGSGASGNGTLTMASFLLSANENLTLAAIMETSSDDAVPEPIVVAAFFEIFELPNDIVGAPVPLPGAVWLLGSGLFGLLAIRRRRPR